MTYFKTIFVFINILIPLLFFRLFAQNQPPEAKFSLEHLEITWGDSLIADGSSSFDPDGDSLSFNWFVKNRSLPRPAPVVINPDSDQIIIYPLTFGKYSVQLIVSDGILQDTLTQQFTVLPLMNNMFLKHTLSDSTWYRAFPYYYQDYILIPLYGKGVLRLYKVDQQGIHLYKDIVLPDTNFVKVNTIKNNYIFIGKQCEGCGYWGPGPISIFQFDMDWNLVPILEDYSPNEYKAIYGIKFDGDSALVTYFPNSIAWIDFISDPANPQILRKKQWDYFQNRKFWNEKYFFIKDSRYSDSLYIFDKYTFNYVQSVDWEKRFYYSDWENKKFGRYSINGDYLLAGNNDSLSIFRINSDFTLDFINSIKIIPPFLNKITDAVEYLPCYRGSLIQDGIVKVKRYGFSYLYDFSKSKHPEPIAYLGDGYYYWSLIESDGYFFLSTIDLNPYSILAEVSIPYFTTISKKDLALPNSFRLRPNYPNPFNPTTKISYDLPTTTFVDLSVFNILGQKICTLIHSKQAAGRYLVEWNGKDAHDVIVPSGVYLYRLKAGNFLKTRKMVLLR